MNLSLHFHELLGAYTAELGDLRHDSEGRDVLAERLRHKRDEMALLLQMIDVDPMMVAPLFHGAFVFDPLAVRHFQEVLSREPDDFGGWSETASLLEIAEWAVPLVDRVLECDEGEAFLTTVAALEFAWWRIDAPAGAPARMAADDESEENEDDEDALERRVDDYLEGQGFDRRSAD